MRKLIAGLMVAPAMIAPTVGAQAPPRPEPRNPVPPQFRGQPTNPTNFNGSGLIPSGLAAPNGFRSIGPVPAPAQQPPAEVKPPELLPPAPLPAPVVAPPAVEAPPPTAPALLSPNPPMLPAMKPIAPPAPAAAAPAGPATTAPAAPGVVVDKVAPETVNAGGKLSYEIVVRNVGQTPVYQARVDEELPAGTRFVASDPPAEANGDRLTWSLGQLDAGAERRLRVQVLPAADGEFRTTALVTVSAAATMRTNVVRPKLALALTGPDQVHVGEPLPLNIQVSNPGTGPASGIVLRVKLPPGLTHPGGSHIEADLGILPPGDSRTIPLRVTATVGGPQAVEMTATGDGSLEASARTEATVLQPVLHIRRAAPPKVVFKSEVTEEYELTNPGNAPAANVVVTELLPAGLEFVGASDGAIFDPVGRVVTWKLGAHPPGASRRIVLKAKAVQVGDLPTRIVAQADHGLETKSDAVVAVEGIPALRLEVVDVEDPVEVGGDIVYEIRVANQGSGACTGIRIVCDVPEGLQAVEAMGPGNFQLQGSQLTFDALPRLATKADVVYRVKVRGVQPGDYRFKVQMTCDQFRLPVNKEESSRVYKNGP